MLALQKRNAYCGSIGIKRIFEVDTPIRKRVFKIGEGLIPDVKKHKVIALKKYYQEHNKIDSQELRRTPLSPSDLQQILQEDSDQPIPEVNFFKNDVFAFGIVLL
jgi:hypothetical protein